MYDANDAEVLLVCCFYVEVFALRLQSDLAKTLIICPDKQALAKRAYDDVAIIGVLLYAHEQIVIHTKLAVDHAVIWHLCDETGFIIEHRQR